MKLAMSTGKKRRRARISLLRCALSDPSGGFGETLGLLCRALAAKTDTMANEIITAELLPEGSPRAPTTSHARRTAIAAASRLAGSLREQIAEGSMEEAVVNLAKLLTTVDWRLSQAQRDRVQTLASLASLLFSCLKSSPRVSVDCISAANQFLGAVDSRWTLEPISKFVIALTAATPCAGGGSVLNVSTTAALLKVPCSEGDKLWTVLDAIQQVASPFLAPSVESAAE